jgi:probable HAF family extracellular repeat protein
MTDLGLVGTVVGALPYPVGSFSASDISNDGTIVGDLRHNNWDEANYASVGYLLGSTGAVIVPECHSRLFLSWARAINEAGQFTGWTVCADEVDEITDQAYRAALNTLTNIGQLYPPLRTEGLAINASGRVVGRSAVDTGQSVSPFHAFRWSPVTGLLDLHPAGDVDYESEARGINAQGLIVGWSSGRLVPSPAANHTYIGRSSPAPASA